MDVGEGQLPQNYRITVVLVKRSPTEKREENLEPAPDLTLFQNDLLMVVGRRNAINQFEKEMGVKGPFRR